MSPRRTVAGLLVAGALATGGGVAVNAASAPPPASDTQAFKLLDGLAYKACSLSAKCRNV